LCEDAQKLILAADDKLPLRCNLRWKIVKERIGKKDELREIKVDATVIDGNLIKQESSNK